MLNSQSFHLRVSDPIRANSLIHPGSPIQTKVNTLPCPLKHIAVSTFGGNHWVQPIIRKLCVSWNLTHQLRWHDFFWFSKSLCFDTYSPLCHLLFYAPIKVLVEEDLVGSKKNEIWLFKSCRGRCICKFDLEVMRRYVKIDDSYILWWQYGVKFCKKTCTGIRNIPWVFVASAGRIHKTNMFPTVFQLCHTGAHTPVLNLWLSTALSITVSSVSSKPLLVTSPTLSCESWGPQSFDGSASELHPDGSKLHSASHWVGETRQKKWKFQVINIFKHAINNTARTTLERLDTVSLNSPKALNCVPQRKSDCRSTVHVWL